ncbi:30S ribosomal protein S3 [Candidatus Woesearchaeota archaeon]|nr:30S ribosomal protein S3 [Candidatus Woesearchaeota archaeon]
MIERKFVASNIREFQVSEYISETLKNVGHSHTKIQKTPLGEKITIFASKPGLIVGRKGENIKKLTKSLKIKFKLENPQIEIKEVENIFLDAQIVAERISSTLERFGSSKFKGIGHKMMADVLNAGGKGIEILISGKVPSSRAKSWRFYMGYLKKCGDIAITGVRSAYGTAKLKTGVIGIQVKIMPPDVKLPDRVEFRETPETIIEEVPSVKGEKKEAAKGEGKETQEEKTKKKAPAKKRAPRKKAAKKQEESPAETPQAAPQEKAERTI